MAQKPISDEVRARVLELHSQGMGRNAIAKEVGISGGSVTAICQKAGGDFSREATAAAVKARVIDCAAIRTQLEQDLLLDAQRLRELIWKPHTYRELGKFSHGDNGGAYSEWVEYDQDTPTPNDQKTLMTAAGAAITQSLRLRDANASTGLDTSRSMLSMLMVELTETYEAAQAEEQAEAVASEPGNV